MIFEQEGSAVKTNNSNVVDFTIANNAMIFSTLSTKLYTKPHEAIVRELVSNAIDANTEAHCDNEIKLHLPTELEPEFYVEDNGIGMDEKTVLDVYCKYGNSTRRNSNEVIGGLGLGSKTPFAYASQFNIETAKDGMKHSYVAFIGEDGKPHIAMAGSEPCSTSGTKVSFPVKEQDFDSFYRGAGKALLFSKKMPKIVNGEREFYRANQDYNESLNNATFVAARNYLANNEFISKDCSEKSMEAVSAILNNMSSRIVAEMGGVAYGIDTTQIYGGKLSCELEGLFGKFTVLHFDMGALAFQASREMLNYTPKTVEAIEKRLISDYMEFYKSRITSTSVDASLNLGKMYQQLRNNEVKTLEEFTAKPEIAKYVSTSNKAVFKNFYDMKALYEKKLEMLSSHTMITAHFESTNRGNYHIEYNIYRPTRPVRAKSKDNHLIVAGVSKAAALSDSKHRLENALVYSNIIYDAEYTSILGLNTTDMSALFTHARNQVCVNGNRMLTRNERVMKFISNDSNKLHRVKYLILDKDLVEEVNKQLELPVIDYYEAEKDEREFRKSQQKHGLRNKADPVFSTPCFYIRTTSGELGPEKGVDIIEKAKKQNKHILYVVCSANSEYNDIPVYPADDSKATLKEWTVDSALKWHRRNFHCYSSSEPIEIMGLMYHNFKIEDFNPDKYIFIRVTFATLKRAKLWSNPLFADAYNYMKFVTQIHFTEISSLVTHCVYSDCKVLNSNDCLHRFSKIISAHKLEQTNFAKVVTDILSHNIDSKTWTDRRNAMEKLTEAIDASGTAYGIDHITIEKTVDSGLVKEYPMLCFLNEDTKFGTFENKAIADYIQSIG